MASVVCEHCHGRVSKQDGVTVREGYSYHEKCHKCYVCSETNLHDAEVFKGVIFCSSCSQRIFQGCSTARKSKNGNRAKTATIKARDKGERSRPQQHRRAESARHRRVNGVLEMTTLTVSSGSDSSNAKANAKKMSSLSLTTKPTLLVDPGFYAEISKDFKKNSIEMGMTTEVTQDLLRQINCPVIDNNKYESKHPPAISPPKEKGDNRYNKTVICSDLRIAELGASTEIAHMALRKKSELPVIIKLEHRYKRKGSLCLSGLNLESDLSADGNNDDWMESTFSLKGTKAGWLDKTIGSLLKMPYKLFKKNVLDRSSLISVLMTSEDSSRMLLKRLRQLFHEEITEHRNRGVKRLYSTINRRRTPYKLGWLNLVAKVSAVVNNNNAIKRQIEQKKKCKHFRRSHSYRCMRAHVMNLAGPTKSQLAVLRSKIMSALSPPTFLMHGFGQSLKTPPVFKSQACGNDAHQLTTPSRSNCQKTR